MPKAQSDEGTTSRRRLETDLSAEAHRAFPHDDGPIVMGAFVGALDTTPIILDQHPYFVAR